MAAPRGDAGMPTSDGGPGDQGRGAPLGGAPPQVGGAPLRGARAPAPPDGAPLPWPRGTGNGPGPGAALDWPGLYGPPPPWGGEGPRPRRRTWWLRYGAPVVAALAKLKILLVAGSVLLSLVAYGLAFGWRFGALFLLILAVHESGHTLALRRRGLPASLPYFIPFLGALITLRRRPRDAAEEAYVAAAGPLFGLAASYALLLLGFLLHTPVLLVAAGFGMLLHIFNLLPITPLDGGRTVAFLRWWAWIPGFCALVVVLFYNPGTHSLAITDPFAPLILAFVVWSAAMEARRRPPLAYAAIGLRAKVAYTGLWLGLLVLAGAGYMLAPRPGLV